MADIVSKLFSDNEESGSEKVSKNIIESDSSSFDRKKRVKPTLSSQERKRTTNIADIIADVFFGKEKEQKKDTSLTTKVSEKTPAGAARESVKENTGKKSKKGGLLSGLKGIGGAVAGIAAAAAALALLVGVGPIPGVLPNLANIDWGMITKAFVILGGLALVGKLMGAGGTGMLAAAAALGILVGIGPIPGVLENMVNIDWMMMTKAFALLGGLALVGKLMGKGSYGMLAAAGALVLLVGIGPIPGALQNLANIDWGTVGKALIILGGIALAGKLMKTGAVGLLLGAAALTLMVRGALVPLQEIEWSTIGKAVVGILALGAVGALAGLVAAPLALGALALGLFGLALIPFTYSMLQFQELEWSTIGKAFVGLLVIGAVGAVFGIASPLIFTGALALGALGAALLPLAAAFRIAAPGFKSFIPLLEKVSKVDAVNLALLGPGLVGLTAGLLALTGGEVLAGIADFFSIGDGPLEKLTELGKVAEPISKLKSGLDALGRIDLDDLKITGDPDVAVDGIEKITLAVYGLLGAQRKSVGYFKDMYNPGRSGSNDFFGSINKSLGKFFGISNDESQFGEFTQNRKPSIVNLKTKPDLPEPPKKDPFKRLTTIMETIRIQLDTLTTYSKLTEDNTGNTVKAIKNIKIGNSSVVPLAGNAGQGAANSGESLLNSRADYSLSPYSLNVPSL
tara:strand:+ start:188 stop:2239 length:2052 start_codon:yes stop_codon:yes gene_type:complete